MGGDLGGIWGTCPQSLRWGTAMHPSPQYLEKQCYEVTKKGEMNDFFVK